MIFERGIFLHVSWHSHLRGCCSVKPCSSLRRQGEEESMLFEHGCALSTLQGNVIVFAFMAVILLQRHVLHRSLFHQEKIELEHSRDWYL